MISTFQIGAALGVAIIGGVFYSALGGRRRIVKWLRLRQAWPWSIASLVLKFPPSTKTANDLTQLNVR